MKRIPIDVNLQEIKLLLSALDSLRYESPHGITDIEDRVIERLEAILVEDRDRLQIDEPKLYIEDEDGYDVLTEEAREGLRENEDWLKSGE